MRYQRSRSGVQPLLAVVIKRISQWIGQGFRLLLILGFAEVGFQIWALELLLFLTFMVQGPLCWILATFDVTLKLAVIHDLMIVFAILILMFLQLLVGLL